MNNFITNKLNYINILYEGNKLLSLKIKINSEYPKIYKFVIWLRKVF